MGKSTNKRWFFAAHSDSLIFAAPQTLKESKQNMWSCFMSRWFWWFKNSFSSYGCWTKNRGKTPPKWMVNIMENPIFLMDDLGETHYFWKHSNIIFMERNSRDFYNVSHSSLFRKHHSHHFHGNLHQHTHTHNSHPKRAQFSMTFPPQQKNPATWVHISTTWGLQHYQYDLYFDGRSFWNVFQSWTHWSFSGDSGGSSAHTERRGRTHEETTNGTAVVVRSQPFSCCWSCGRVLRFCLVETCGLGGGFEIYVYKYWRIPFVFLFRHHLFLNWWSWFAWFVDFFKRFPNQKNGQPKIPASISEPGELGYCFFFFFVAFGSREWPGAPLEPEHGHGDISEFFRRSFWCWKLSGR